jgi:hypothetical protein
MKAFKSGSPKIQSHYPIPYQDIYQVCPAVFAAQPAPDRSKYFKHVSTIEALEALGDEGFRPFMVAQTKPRDADKMGYARHMVRLRRESDIKADGANEVIIYNANDGTSAATMLSGHIRFACANGLVTGDSLNTVKIYHRGNITGEYIEGAYTILKDFERVDASRDEMQSIQLTRDAALIFAEEALNLKYDGVAPITADRLLEIRRIQDSETSLWTKFNVIQENLLKGGQSYYNKEKGKRGRTRAVTGISESRKLNQALWSLSEKMAQLVH